jgi:gamma-butyrobetaine dioxygenase
VVTFDPDGHRSVFRRDWLASQDLAPQGGADPDLRTEDGKVLWRAADLAAPHTADWAAYTSDDRVREGCLGAVARYGCALLRGVPVAAGMVLEVAATFGYVRETNYGRLFDVRVEPDPDNLAFTSREIAPHTDNPCHSAC